MPWENKGIMSLREEFVLKVKSGFATISELCRMYKISRPTAYKWLKRYSEEGKFGLIDRSKRPSQMPKRTNDKLTTLILATREKYSAWGGRKLRQVLLNEGYKHLPSEPTFNRILKRQDKIDPKESEQRKKWIRFERDNPNELWQMDFKGYFATSEGKCHPLTVLDDCSRYSICLKACQSESEPIVRTALEQAFRKYGLPEAMTMDNGVPWMGAPGCRLSKLTIWLMRLGIKVGHSRLNHPQTQGKDERFHRSLKEELLKYHNFYNLEDAQKHFDEWREIYNHIRPHEALNMQCPGQRYHISQKRFIEKLPSIEYRSEDVVRRVRNNGSVCFRGTSYYVGIGLGGEYVAIRARNEYKWDIYYVNTRILTFEKV